MDSCWYSELNIIKYKVCDRLPYGTNCETRTRFCKQEKKNKYFTVYIKRTLRSYKLWCMYFSCIIIWKEQGTWVTQIVDLKINVCGSLLWICGLLVRSRSLIGRLVVWCQKTPTHVAWTLAKVLSPNHECTMDIDALLMWLIRESAPVVKARQVLHMQANWLCSAC